MLKLIKSEIPSGAINGTNTEYILSQYIGYVSTIVVDGVTLANSLYSFTDYTISLVTPASHSIVVDYFYREQVGMMGDGEVLFGDLIRDVYDEIGRQEYSDIYKRERVERELNKTILSLYNKVSEKERLLTYSLVGFSSLKVTALNVITGTIPVGQEEEGIILVRDNIILPYYDYTAGVFTINNEDNGISVGDKVIVGHRIPYGVNKVSTVFVDGIAMDFIDQRKFNIDIDSNYYTIVKTERGDEYILLPYNDRIYTMTVTFYPNTNLAKSENTYVDIPYEYTRVIVYDVVYRLLASREDERYFYYKSELQGTRNGKGLLAEYASFVGGKTKKTKTRIGVAKTYGENYFSTRDYNNYI